MDSTLLKQVNLMSKSLLFSVRRKQGSHADMTGGSIASHLISFSLPLLAGNVFQQLYNTVDAWVVGNYVSNEAFSAVGTVGPIINMLIGFFLGLSTGAGVVISQYFGAHRYDKVHDTVHTAFVMTLVLGVVLSALGIFLIPTMLSFMKTPDEVVPESTTYLTIYFAGMLGLMIYNIGSGILRAVGDSRRPFYFLVVSAVLNTVLDLVFVLAFGMGVEGVAYATVIAEAVSAVLVILSLHKSDTCVVLRFRDLRIHTDMLLKIIRIGIPAAVQTAITCFSNVFVQSYINVFGPDCMSGWTAYSKIDQFLLLPMQSLAIASTTFVGQNLGVGDVKRAKKGVSYAFGMALGSTFLLMIPILLFAPGMVGFFNAKEAVITYGTGFLRFILPFYLLCCVNQIYTYATVIAEAVSAVLVILSLHKSDTCVVLRFRDLRIHTDMLLKIIRIGIPAAVQTAITCFSNVFVQSYINVFGPDCMSGWTAYSKIDQFLLLPMQSLAIASTTFVGQNLGVGDVKRAKKGVSYAFGMALGSTFLLMIPILLFAPGMVGFFNAKEAVITYGTGFLRFILPFYLLCCVNQIYTGALRGSGNSRTPMLIMLFSFVVFRQIYLYLMSHYGVNEPIPIALGYPAGWLVCSAITFVYYSRTDLSKCCVVETTEAA